MSLVGLTFKGRSLGGFDLSGELLVRGFFVFLGGLGAELERPFFILHVPIVELQFAVLRVLIRVVVVELLKFQVSSSKD